MNETTKGTYFERCLWSLCDYRVMLLMFEGMYDVQKQTEDGFWPKHVVVL
jgi:hypothetical protein